MQEGLTQFMCWVPLSEAGISVDGLAELCYPGSVQQGVVLYLFRDIRSPH